MPDPLYNLTAENWSSETRVPKLGYTAAYTKQAIRDKLIEHKEYIAKYGEDMPEVCEWTWKWNDA